MASARGLVEATLDSLARHARLILIAGLLVGLFVPGAAQAAKPWIAEMIGALLFMAALRVGPRQLLGAVRDIGQSVSTSLLLQLALPLLLILIFHLVDWRGALPTALILMAAAPPISGSPHLAIMTGNDPAPALRVMTLGTALMPLTVVPVFWFMPALGDSSLILTAAGRLLSVIAVAVAAAFIVRGIFLKSPGPRAIRSMDGISALLMGLIVIGLMSAMGAMLWVDPLQVLFHLAVAFAANFLLQIAAALFLEKTGRQTLAGPLGIVAGNRNISLFLTALPATITDPLLLYIGCYQVPIYLTPMLLGRFYRKRAASAKPHSGSSSED